MVDRDPQQEVVVPQEYVSTFGVDPDPEAGIPLALLHYVLAITMIAREKMTKTGVLKNPRGIVRFYGNDLSRFGVRMAHELGGPDRVPGALQVAFEENEHPQKDKILRVRDELIGLTYKRVAAIEAGCAYLPTLGEYGTSVGSLIEHVRKTPTLRMFIMSFMDAILTGLDSDLGGASDHITVRDTITSLLPPRLLGGSDDERMKNGMYGPLQAAAAAAFIKEGKPYVTYKGRVTVQRPHFADKTLHDMTRFLAAEGTLGLLSDTDLGRKIARQECFGIHTCADGWAFSSTKASQTDPFYVADGAGAGTDTDTGSTPDTKLPWMDGNMELVLDSKWWDEHVGIGPQCAITNPGAKRVVAKIVNPLLSDLLAGGSSLKVMGRMGVLVRSSNAPRDAQRIMEAALARIEVDSVNGGQQSFCELLPFSADKYRDLAVTLAAVIAEEAKDIYKAYKEEQGRK